MIFESELEKGKFSVGECAKCQKTTWPPNDFCSTCFGSLNWRQVKQPGIVIEYSAKDDKTFCLAEFEGAIRVMGVILSTPKIGQRIRVADCGFDGLAKFSFISE